VPTAEKLVSTVPFSQGDPGLVGSYA
jgi:hypothetical protein